MKKQNSGVSAEGRTPPPAESRFRKGRAGNPTGRPKGSISLSRITRKVALKKHSLRIEDKPRRLTTLELVILKLKGIASKRPSPSCQSDKLVKSTDRAIRCGTGTG